MEINHIISDFEKQVHIPPHELNTLSGFIRFLINQSEHPEYSRPYGLLVQYTDEHLKEIFLDALNDTLPRLSTERHYHLSVMNENGLSNTPLRYFSAGKILVLDICSEQGSLAPIISEFEKTPDIIKIVCAPSDVVEKRFRANEHFFYRILARHIHLQPLRSQEITHQFLNVLTKNGYKYTEEFQNEIEYYIDSIYDTADFKNQDFIQDLLRRIELQMEEKEGISAYKTSLTIDSSFRPYSLRVVARRKAELHGLTGESENHVQKHPSDSSGRHTNVLLLALSTFGALRESSFSYEEHNFSTTVSGKYQLDPVPKMLHELLAQQKETLDQIIMLCTEDTRKETTIKTPEGEEITVSPENYFKAQVRDYVNPGTDDQQKFVSVPVSLDSPYQGIQDVIDTLRRLHKPRLYLDAHGGLRGIQRILEATVSLLKVEGIRIEKVFGIEYSDRNSKSNVNRIIDETDRVKIFDFVSGINEFISCGRADNLLSYTKSIEKENALINAIKRVADGIQWCCVQEFEEGLADLQTAVASSPDPSVLGDFSYLDIYRANIRQDYGNLIGEHSVIDEINWCLKKGFYQQALTLIESKVSTLLIEDWNLLTVNEDYSRCKNKRGVYKIKGRKKAVAANDLFNAFVYQIQRGLLDGYKTSNSSPILFITTFNDLSEKGYEDFLNSIHVESLENIRAKEIRKILSKALQKTTLSPVESIPDCLALNDDVNSRILFQLLILHKELKKVRNAMNHASDEFQYDTEAVKRALKYYMKWLEQLAPGQQTKSR